MREMRRAQINAHHCRQWLRAAAEKWFYFCYLNSIFIKKNEEDSVRVGFWRIDFSKKNKVFMKSESWSIKGVPMSSYGT